MSLNADELLRAAEAAKKAGRYADSLALYQRYVALRPGDAGGWTSVGYNLIALQDSESALAPLGEALRLNPDYSPAHLLRGRALERRGDTESAIAEYRSGILTASAAAVDPYYAERLARLLMARDATKDAERFAREGLKSWPNALELRKLLAEILTKLRRWREAAAEYEAILASCPDDHDVVCTLAWALANAGDLRGARLFCEQALVLRPDEPETLVRLGGIMRRLGRLDEAEAAFRRALELSPTYVSARVWLASLLGGRWEATHRKSDLEAARSEIGEALALAPETDAARLILSNIEWNMGNREQSLQIIEQAIQRQPDLPEYHYLLVVRSLRQGKFRRAWTAWRSFRRVATKPWDRNAVWNALPPAPSVHSGGETPPGADSAADRPDTDLNSSEEGPK